jgi:hypothetical protein
MCALEVPLFLYGYNDLVFFVFFASSPFVLLRQGSIGSVPIPDFATNPARARASSTRQLGVRRQKILQRFCARRFSEAAQAFEECILLLKEFLHMTTASSTGVVTGATNLAIVLGGAMPAFYVAEKKAPALIVRNSAGKEMAFGPAEWDDLPQNGVHKAAHSGVTSVYEGVLLSDLLGAAGVTLGKELRGPLLAAYVLAEAKDGFRVVYSIGEIDPETGTAPILVANKKNGKPLSALEGPYRFVLPQDKQATRWLRQVTRVSLHQLPPPAIANPHMD